MTPEEKETLRDIALELALAKMQVLIGVHAHLAAAVQQCRDWQKGMNTFESDTEIHELGEKIQALWWSLPRCGAPLFEALTQREPGAFDYVDGNDVLRLRQKEAETHGIVFSDDDDRPYDKLPREEPLALFLRLKAEVGC